MKRKNKSQHGIMDIGDKLMPIVYKIMRWNNWDLDDTVYGNHDLFGILTFIDDFNLFIEVRNIRSKFLMRLVVISYIKFQIQISNFIDYWLLNTR